MVKYRRKLSYRVTQMAEEQKSEASGFCAVLFPCPQGSPLLAPWQDTDVWFLAPLLTNRNLIWFWGNSLSTLNTRTIFSGFPVAQGVRVMYFRPVECKGWLIVGSWETLFKFSSLGLSPCTFPLLS